MIIDYTKTNKSFEVFMKIKYPNMSLDSNRTGYTCYETQIMFVAYLEGFGHGAQEAWLQTFKE
jgi:hypothetical protein